MGVRNFAAKLSIIGELFFFLWKNKRWWLIPVLVVLVIIGLLLVFSQNSVIGPFIYSLF
ncbi:MAG: DUF5989 family protein [Candidatus Aminicenantes bacterium]|jgi:hypothetical protein|nr:DUF5989 family protein [Candidatus Aminicenantes bacterium]